MISRPRPTLATGTTTSSGATTCAALSKVSFPGLAPQIGPPLQMVVHLPDARCLHGRMNDPYFKSFYERNIRAAALLRFAITAKGYFALMPSIASPGDTI